MFRNTLQLARRTVVARPPPLLPASAQPHAQAQAQTAQWRGYNGTAAGSAPEGSDDGPKIVEIPGFKDLKISVVGAGMMAEAMADGLKAKELLFPGNLHVCDLNAARSNVFVKKFGAVVHDSLQTCVADADVVLLSVKPQNFKTVGAELKGSITDNTVVLSIIAGLPLDALQECTGAARVVRSMPNTPAAVQEGITMWTCTEALTQGQRLTTSTMLQAFGEEIHVNEEAFLDMATAVSGSGPAYVFLMMEAMIDSGVHFGMPRHIATKLVYQTVKGSAVYAMNSESNPAKLRADITSPGGTTASALYTLEREGLRSTVSEGLWSAYRRSLELGNQNSDVGPGRSSSGSKY